MAVTAVSELMKEYFRRDNSPKILSEQLRDSLPIEPKKAEWKISQDGKFLIRSYSFNNFPSMLTFVADLLQMQEELQHHGQILILEKEVKVKVTTATLERVTEIDTEYASQLDMIYRDSQDQSGSENEL